LHPADEIWPDFDKAAGLVITRRPTVLAVIGRDSKFIVKFA